MRSRRSLLPFIVVVALVPRLSLAVTDPMNPTPKKQEAETVASPLSGGTAIQQELAAQPITKAHEIPQSVIEGYIQQQAVAQAARDAQLAKRNAAKPLAPPAPPTDLEDEEEDEEESDDQYVVIDKKAPKPVEDKSVEVSLGDAGMSSMFKGYFHEIEGNRKLVVHGKARASCVAHVEATFDAKNNLVEYTFKGKKSEYEACKRYADAVCEIDHPCERLENQERFKKALGAKSGKIYVQADDATSDADETNVLAKNKLGDDLVYKSSAEIEKEKLAAKKEIALEKVLVAQHIIANCRIDTEEERENVSDVFAYWKKNLKSVDAENRDKKAEKKLAENFELKLKKSDRVILGKAFNKYSTLDKSERGEYLEELKEKVDAYAREHSGKKEIGYVSDAYNQFALTSLAQMSIDPEAGSKALLAYQEALNRDDLTDAGRKALEKNYLTAAQALLARTAEKGPTNKYYLEAKEALKTQLAQKWNDAGCDPNSGITPDAEVCNEVKQMIAQGQKIELQSQQTVAALAQRDQCLSSGKTLLECNALLPKVADNSILNRALGNTNTTAFSEYSASQKALPTPIKQSPVFANLSVPAGQPQFVANANAINSNTFFKTGANGQVTGLLGQ